MKAIREILDVLVVSVVVAVCFWCASFILSGGSVLSVIFPDTTVCGDNPFIVCQVASSPQEAATRRAVIVLTQNAVATANAAPVTVYQDEELRIVRLGEASAYIYVCYYHDEIVPCTASPVATPVH